jgi:methionine-rich copper-binding protein CopC
MRNHRWMMVAVFLCVASFATAGPLMVESWDEVNESSTGTYADSNGSTVKFSPAKGKKKEKALLIESDLKTGGYCGVWHTLSAETGKADALVFNVKGDQAGEVQVALKDVNNVQYTTTFSLSKGDWSAVTLLFSSFKKDPYYTPPDAIVGKPVDFSTLKAMNVSSQVMGTSKILVGAVKAVETGKGAVPTSVPTAAQVSEPSKEGVVVESWVTMASSNTGTYMDSNGSTLSFSMVDGPKSGEKAVSLEGNLKQGGYLGIWHTLSADLSKASFLRFQAKGVVGDVQVALKDKYNVQYVAIFQVGKEWTEVLLPLASFQKDPYYTPPEAITGKPMDLSEVKSMNLAPQTAGVVGLMVGPVEAVAQKK